MQPYTTSLRSMKCTCTAWHMHNHMLPACLQENLCFNPSAYGEQCLCSFGENADVARVGLSIDQG